MSMQVNTEWMSGPHINENGTFLSDQELGCVCKPSSRKGGSQVR